MCILPFKRDALRIQNRCLPLAGGVGASYQCHKRSSGCKERMIQRPVCELLLGLRKCKQLQQRSQSPRSARPLYWLWAGAHASAQGELFAALVSGLLT
uniref:Uncharacterized protein n=1 Tax=Hyaloperonospora arabidopsidis (strain Emoy2) TaxID=559515 RepID=M4BNB9_HYAAE